MKELTTERSSESARRTENGRKIAWEGIFFLNKMCLPLSRIDFCGNADGTGWPRNPHGGVAAATPAT